MKIKLTEIQESIIKKMKEENLCIKGRLNTFHGINYQSIETGLIVHGCIKEIAVKGLIKKGVLVLRDGKYYLAEI